MKLDLPPWVGTGRFRQDDALSKRPRSTCPWRGLAAAPTGIPRLPSGVLKLCTSGDSVTKSRKETLLEQERFELKPKSGGGLLSYEVWGYREHGKDVVTRYSLAYINPLVSG